MTDTSWLEVDLLGLRRNIQAWRGLLRAPGEAGEMISRAPAKLCAVLKADAYGLGAAELGRCLGQAGVDMLAVYSPAQADELLTHAIDRPILLLMPVRTRPETVRLQNALFTGQLHLTVDSPDQLLAVHNLGASYGAQIPIHLSLDTGMSRGGLSADQLTAILRRLPRMRHVRLAGIWTHFAAAESDAALTGEQFQAFTRAIMLNRRRIGKGVMLHAAATAGALADRAYHLHMVRIGLGMFGYGPSAAGIAHPTSTQAVGADLPVLPRPPRLAPILRWRSRIIHVRRYPAGATVGYTGATRLMRDSFLGLIPVGYADGYPLALSGKGSVQVLPRSAVGCAAACRPIDAPVLGRVNMDQIIIDLTPGPRAGEQAPSPRSAGGQPRRPTIEARAPIAQVGDVVDVISPDPASACALPRLAHLAGTSCYELLCRISPRVPRLYMNTPPSAALVALDRLKVTVP